MSIITRQYVLLFAIALTIGAPVSYYIIDFVLDFAYVYHVPMNALGVLIAVCSLLITLLVVIGIQVKKVSKQNPAKGLRTE